MEIRRGQRSAFDSGYKSEFPVSFFTGGSRTSLEFKLWTEFADVNFASSWEPDISVSG
jgi:hypothetical protein